MKILAVRGSNLASLVELELALDREPLSSVGLFAITGPTGAGKSTVLDAMCLALFDKTPRVASAGRTLVAGVTANDPRTLLRRGAGEGWAECDFVGRDGVPYRARWHVRRAHGKVTGALQEQKVTLTDLRANQSIGSTKTDVLAEIRKRLGLDFDQFRRSALLAQGDFAAFLAADPDARATLLERMTGADIYTEISKRAYQRAAEERDALALLEGELAQKRVLSDEDRGLLVDAIAQIEAEQRALGVKLERLAESARWQATAARLETGLAEAERARSESRALLDGASPRVAALQQIEAVQIYRPVFERCQRAETEVASLDAQATQAERLHDEATVDLASVQRVGAQRHEEWAERARQQAQLAPLWEAAQRLDSLLEDKRGVEELAQVERTAIRTRAEASRSALHTTTAALARAREARSRAERALEAGGAWSELTQGWASWRGVLEDLGATLVAIEAGESRRAGLVASLTAADVAREAGRVEHERASIASGGLSLDEAEQKAKAASDWVASLERFAGIEATGEVHAAALRRLRALQSELALAIEAESGAASDARAQLETLRRRLDLDERALDLLRAQRDLTAHRAMLLPGEPCPLCGAVEHPLAKGVTADRTIEDLEKQVVAARQEQATLTATEARASLGAQRAASEHVRVTQELVGVGDAQAAWALEREAQLIALREVDAELEVETALTHAKEAALVAQALREASVKAITLAQALYAQDATCERQRAELDALSHQLVERTQLRDRLRGRLAAVLTDIPGWEDELARDAHGFVERCAEQMRARMEQSDVAARASADVVRLEGELQQRRGESESDERELARQDEALTELEAQRRRLGDERAALFATSVAESKRAMQENLDRAHAAWQDADKRIAMLDRLRTEREVRWTELRALCVRKEAEANEAAQVLLGVLAEMASSRIELGALLERDPAWVASERDALMALRDGVAASETALAERQRARLEHESVRPSAEATAGLDPAALEVEQRSCQERLDERRYALRSDDEARAAGAALGPRIVEQRERWRKWDRLKEVMGAADGKPFRAFAQRVTLDALLLDANHQLLKLAPRYRLERVPGSNMDLSVVDQDMGDERRSVSSLSGGESFLVSLALALALSSFSARDTRIETLFIDEGFGALDAHTLDVALAALDALQASGCQVGVISHVTALTERMGVRAELMRKPGGMSTLVVR